jgi:hypothetical protein
MTYYIYDMRTYCISTSTILYINKKTKFSIFPSILSLQYSLDDKDFLDELTCVKYLRAATPRQHTASTSSLTSLGTSCSSDCDDSLGPSPLPSPFILDKSAFPELVSEISFDDYFNDAAFDKDELSGTGALSVRKEAAWAPIAMLSSAMLSSEARAGREAAFFSAVTAASFHAIPQAVPFDVGVAALAETPPLAHTPLLPRGTPQGGACRAEQRQGGASPVPVPPCDSPLKRGRSKKIPSNFDVYEI